MVKHIYSAVKFRTPKSIDVKRLYKKTGYVGFALRKNHKIEMEPNQTNKEYFLTYFHEICHLMLPSLTEKEVRKLEKYYGRKLWDVVLKLNRKKKNGPMAK